MISRIARVGVAADRRGLNTNDKRIASAITLRAGEARQSVSVRVLYRLDMALIGSVGFLKEKIPMLVGLSQVNIAPRE